MTADLQEPLIPAEVDLRDFPFMPLEIERLRRSKQWLKAKRSPELGFYMLNLWMGSWHNVPAGSLEDDDDVLSDMACCDLKRWAKVRADVLRGWVKCADGRLYHAVITEKVMDAWARKLEQRLRTLKARIAKLEKRIKAERNAIEKQRLQMLLKSLIDELKICTKFPSSLHVTDDEGSADEADAECVTESVTDNATDSNRQGQGQGQGQTNSLNQTVGVNAAGAANNTDDLILAFDAALVGAWGEGARRSRPHSTDAATAKQWSEGGITATLAGRVLRERFEKMRSRGAKPPFSMSAFGDEIRRVAVVQPAEQSSERGGDDERSRWRKRLIGFRDMNGFWPASFGDPPGEPGCLAPGDLVAEILPHLKPTADVIPLMRAAQ